MNTTWKRGTGNKLSVSMCPTEVHWGMAGVRVKIISPVRTIDSYIRICCGRIDFVQQQSCGRVLHHSCASYNLKPQGYIGR